MSETNYSSIPEAPQEYTAATVLSRYIDGLGFRYHWATEGLSDEALAYRPEPSCRSIAETLDHIHNIVDMVQHSIQGNRYSLPEPTLSEDMDVRAATLEKIATVSETLRALDPAEIPNLATQFRAGEDDLDFPFWNTINGTMSDALYHVGQVVALRRAAGHPMDKGVNVFLGIQSPPAADA